MNFKVDENLPHECALEFRRADHATHTVSDEDLSGTGDATLMESCRTEARILVSLDLDFADIRARPPGSHPGIIVLRHPRKTSIVSLR